MNGRRIDWSRAPRIKAVESPKVDLDLPALERSRKGIKFYAGDLKGGLDGLSELRHENLEKAWQEAQRKKCERELREKEKRARRRAKRRAKRD